MPDPDRGPTLLGGRLLSVVVPPAGNPITDLLREIGASWTPARRCESTAGAALPTLIRDWRWSSPTLPSDRLAAVALTPERGTDPILDVVVMPGAPLTFRNPTRRAPRRTWSATATITAQNRWEAPSGRA